MRNLANKLRSFWIQDVSFTTLLILLLLTIFILPVVYEDDSELGLSLFKIALLVLFFVGIWSTTNSYLLITSISLFTLQLVFNIVKWLSPEIDIYFMSKLTSIANTVVFIIINLALLFRDDNFNVNRVIGAVNVYLLVALAGSFFYEIIFHFYGSSLEGNISLEENGNDFHHYIYFSLVSMTTVGFGDIYPVNMAARMLSVFLSAVGILYPAVIIAKLVSASSVKAHNDK